MKTVLTLEDSDDGGINIKATFSPNFEENVDTPTATLTCKILELIQQEDGVHQRKIRGVDGQVYDENEKVGDGRIKL